MLKKLKEISKSEEKKFPIREVFVMNRYFSSFYRRATSTQWKSLCDNNHIDVYGNSFFGTIDTSVRINRGSSCRQSMNSYHT